MSCVKGRLLTLDDLCEFYSTKKRAVHFDCSESDGKPIVVQTKGTMKFEETEDEAPDGLLPVTFQHALHTGENLNHSYISKETMEDRLLPTFINRPILGYIHYIDDVPYFKGHEMHEDPETDEIVYDEVPVGVIPETNNAQMVYDEEKDRYNVLVDGYIFEEYSKAEEIIEREGECPVSVEIAIKEMSYSPKEGTLVIEDGYFSGITILGKDDAGNDVRPGMEGSKVTLKDFKAEGNSALNAITPEEESTLINTLEKLNATLSSLDIENKNYRKEESTAMEDEKDLNEEETLEETESETVAGENETVTTEDESQGTPEVAESEDPIADNAEGDPDEDEEPEDGPEDEPEAEPEGETDEGEDEVEEPEEEESLKEEETADEPEAMVTEATEKFVRTFELSHEDVRYALYSLLEPYEEADNDYYWIDSVYDDYFIYESAWTGKYFKQAYTVDEENDLVEFNGERVEVYSVFLTEEEKAEVEDMRANYSLIKNELGTYKEKELHEQREEILANADYAEYLGSDAFKEIKKNLDTYSLEDLQTQCELAYAKALHSAPTKATFAQEEPKKESVPFFGFARAEHESSFLDGLLKQAKH